MVKLPVTGHPGIGSRLPRSGSLSPVVPENLVLTIHAFCRNSNWREILALRQMKCNPRGDSLGEAGASALLWRKLVAVPAAPPRTRSHYGDFRRSSLFLLACIVLIDSILLTTCHLAFSPSGASSRSHLANEPGKAIFHDVFCREMTKLCAVAL